MALLKDSLPDERDRAIPGIRRPGAPELQVIDGGQLPQVEEDAEGGATVTFDDGKKPQAQGLFDENLADGFIDETELENIARDLLRKIELDKEARIKRDQQYEEGLRRTGLGDDAPGGAGFTGASRVTHPMLTEACVDFHASSMKELFPPSGPVKTEIIGEKTPAQLKLADRQYRYMNWQMTEQIEEYADELSVTLTQLPMAGSQYMKFWKDDELDRVACEFVPIDDILVPYGVNSFWASHRITHVMRLTEGTYESRVDSGWYRDLPDLENASAIMPEQTAAAKASDRIEGAEQPMENLDGIRLVYECSTYLKLDIDGGKRLPYLVTIDERTNRIVCIYRNWEETDRQKKRLHWIVDFNFIPWRGAQKMGFAQMLGGLSAAATGSLRALLDSALVQTIPVLAKLKGAKMGSQTKTIDPLSVTEIEAGTAVDDIRKVLMAMPFNPPSPVLYALLGWLTDAAKGVVTTAEEKIADASNQMPVGTALALMESGAKVFSSIHAGLHRSQKKALQIIARLNKQGVDEEGQVAKFGQVVATTRDFEEPLGVIPVSDPNIFSEGQRYAQMQLVTGFALGMDPKTGQPTATARMHNMHAVLKRTYELAKIPNIDEILPPEKTPTELNAAAENSSVMLGNPIMAFPEQNHLAHLETHIRFVLDPLVGGGALAIATAWPKMVEHIKQHVSMLYAQTMHRFATEALGMDVTEAMKDRSKWNKIDEVLAAASPLVHDEMQRVLGPLGPIIEQMSQKVEQMKPPMPMDPSQAAVLVAQMEDRRKREEMGAKNQQTQQQQNQTAAKDQAADARKGQELEIKAADVNLKHGLGAEKLQIESEGQEHDRLLAEEQARRESQDQQHRQHLERRGADREDRTAHHQQALDVHGARREDAAFNHQRQSDQRSAARDDRAQAHTERLDVADHRLREGEAASKAGLEDRKQRLAEGGQAHDQLMAEGEFVRGVQEDEHTRRMDKTAQKQQAREHEDQLELEERKRRDANANADKDRKAAADAAKAKAKDNGKGEKK